MPVAAAAEHRTRKFEPPICKRRVVDGVILEVVVELGASTMPPLYTNSEFLCVLDGTQRS